MTSRLFSLLFVVAACSSAPSGGARPPDPVNSPPATNDPGSPRDVDPTPPSTAPPPETTPSGGGTSAATKADGSPCLTADECTSGVCEGQGCGDSTPGTCAAKSRPCTRDLRTYCGCDGKTFQASGSCPLRRYAAKNKCDRS
ncbi:MAG TPA: hypothetical protein VK427_03220 [Kofleriaceae bacterium]|nr:hypothetical protein [Kofleriaceae bacterium]